MSTTMKRHILQCKVENKFGVLARIASLFSARWYNIKSLAVAETNDPSVSVVTMVVNAEDETILEQIQKQLNKLIDVITVKDITSTAHTERELMMIRVAYDGEARKKIDALCERFFFRIYGAKDDSAILEVSGSNLRLEELLKELEGIGIRELVRSGKIAMTV